MRVPLTEEVHEATRDLDRRSVEEIVEADLSRPARVYAVSDQYLAGDRISHPILGEGVVQGLAGDGKIRVRFDESEKVLVHERAVSA